MKGKLVLSADAKEVIDAGSFDETQTTEAKELVLNLLNSLNFYMKKSGAQQTTGLDLKLQDDNGETKQSVAIKLKPESVEIIFN